MAQIKRKQIITYNWWNSSDEIPVEHLELLDEHAIDRINRMRSEGYTSGELRDEIDWVDYSGWWELTTETL